MNRGDLSWYVFVIVCDIAILHCVYGFESALVLGSVWFCCVVFLLFGCSFFVIVVVLWLCLTCCSVFVDGSLCSDFVFVTLLCVLFVMVLVSSC